MATVSRKEVVSNRVLLVCGGCLFKDLTYLVKTLDELHAEDPIEMIIEGDASGADEMAGMWARARGVALAVVTPNWRYYGKSAWWRRNESMLSLSPTRVLAFPGTGGTKHMVNAAKEKKVPVLQISCEQYEAETGKPALMDDPDEE